MSDYTEKLLARIEKEQKAKELKEAGLEPMNMAAADEAEMDFDLDTPVSDSEYAESFFNDDAHGDETQVDLDEQEEITDADSIDELVEKEIKDKKKKKGRTGELEEQEYAEQEPLFTYGHTTVSDEQEHTASPVSEQEQHHATMSIEQEHTMSPVPEQEQHHATVSFEQEHTASPVSEQEQHHTTLSDEQEYVEQERSLTYEQSMVPGEQEYTASPALEQGQEYVADTKQGYVEVASAVENEQVLSSHADTAGETAIISDVYDKSEMDTPQPVTDVSTADVVTPSAEKIHDNIIDTIFQEEAIETPVFTDDRTQSYDTLLNIPETIVPEKSVFSAPDATQNIYEDKKRDVVEVIATGIVEEPVNEKAMNNAALENEGISLTSLSTAAITPEVHVQSAEHNSTDVLSAVIHDVVIPESVVPGESSAKTLEQNATNAFEADKNTPDNSATASVVDNTIIENKSVVIDNIINSSDAREEFIAAASEKKITETISQPVPAETVSQVATSNTQGMVVTSEVNARIIDAIVEDRPIITQEPLTIAAEKADAHKNGSNAAFAEEQQMQDKYVENYGSNAGYDTRAAVAEMVPDEQIKGVTQSYVSQPDKYRQEFSQEVQAVMPNSTSVPSAEKNEAKNRASGTDAAFTVSSQENDTRAVSSDKEVRTKSVADDHVEQRETEIKQSEFKEQMLHKFVEVANAATRQLENGGQRAIHAVTSEISSADKNTKAGFDDLKKMGKPVAEIATIVGMSALASSYSDEMKLLGKAGANADKLIAEGKLTVADLSLSKKELNAHLKEAGVSLDERQSILRHRTDIHDMMGVRSEMRSMVATGQIKVDEKLAEVLQGSTFFNVQNSKTGQLLQMYYKNSSDDIIRNVFGNTNFTAKSARTFRKFLSKSDANEISANGRAAVRMGKLAASGTRSNRLLSAHLSMKLKGTARSMISNVTTYDQNTALGYKNLTQVGSMSSRSVKIGAKVLIGTRRHGYKGLAVNSIRVVKKIMIGTKKHGYKGIATQIGRSVIRFAKYTDKSFYALTNHSIGHFVKVTQNNIRQGMNATRENIRAAGEIAKKKVIVAAQEAKRKAASTAAGKQVVKINNARIDTTNKAVTKYKEAQRKARALAKEISQTKAAKAAYATGNAVAKGGKLFIGTPVKFGAGVFRKAKLVVGKIFSAFSLVKKYIVISAAVFCAIYIVLVLAVMGMLTIFNQDTNAVMNVILPERDAFVAESIDRYLQKSEDIKDAAVDIGEGTPITNTVTSSHTISKYGHPAADGSWVQGYNIYYTDSDGNIIQDGMNNVKDTLVLAYVQMDAEWKSAKESDATDLMDKYFEWLNPNSDAATMLANSEETDIYFCDNGCETVYYKCKDSATMTNSDHSYMSQSEISTQSSNGTKFYGSITSSSDGCYYTTSCDGCVAIIPNGVGMAPSIVPVNHGDGTNAAPNGCNNYTTTYYCNGHSVEACYGHRDIAIYIPIKTMQDAFDESYMVAEHTFLTFLNNGQWTEDDQDWCWGLYNGDWYDLYGVDPSGGLGFTVGSSLTQEEIDAVLANCGTASELRQNLISTALSQVGAVPYYYGGKPTSGGVPISTNHGTAGGAASCPDHIGRTVAGLDCFGFCQWVYWNTTGSNIMPEGSSYTTTTVYNSASCGNLTRLTDASQLQIGDLGFQAGHVGIFAGVSADGSLMWIHCSGGANTAVYGEYNGFNRFYRLNGLE